MHPASAVRPWPLSEARRLRPDDALARSRARIEEAEPQVRAWVAMAPDEPAGDGPLAGVPIGVKDIIDVVGLPTRCGSPALSDAAPATADADVVAMLRACGAVVVGKTVTTEFAYFDPGPTRNPHDPDRTPGGSSSGSAAAVAAGMVPLAVGTQTAGSVIRPASFCGVAALAVAHGTLPMSGVTALAPSLDTLGLFAASVADVVVARAALGGPQPAGAQPPRLLSWDGSDVAEPDPAMRAVHARVADRAGARPLGVDLRRAAADQATVMAAEVAATVPELDGIGPNLAALIAQGRAVVPGDLEAARARSAATRAEVLARLDDADAILAPGALGAAPRGLERTGDPAMSRPGHVLGLPALAVPGARDADGMPLGLQLLGHPGREDALLAAGRWIETHLGDPAR